MIELSTNSQLPKTYTSLTTYFSSLQQDISAIVKLLLGTGIASVSSSELVPTINTSYTLGNGNYELYFESSYPKPVAASYVETSQDKGLLIESLLNGTDTATIPFDEQNSILNGSTNNPIEVPYPNLTSLSIFPQHKVSGIASVIYVNGTPQPSGNISVISQSQTAYSAQIAFSSIVSGLIYPDPTTPSGTITDAIISAPMQTWFTTFGDPIELSFSNLNLRRTNRPLILDLYDINTSTRTYLLVNPTFEENKPYYEIVDVNTLRIHIPASTQAAFPPSSTQMRVYFATPLSTTEINTSTNKFFRQYKLPYTDLLPDDSDLVIFSISNTSGEIKELVSSSNALVGSLYSLDYIQGVLSVYNIGGTIPDDETIAIGGVKYTPPLKPTNISDYANTVSLYFQSGGVFAKSNVNSTADLPNNLYVYMVPKAHLNSVISYINSNGNIATIPNIRVFSNGLLISETTLTSWTISPTNYFSSLLNIEPIPLGTLSKNGLNYTFSSNSVAFDPYSKLLALAGNLSLISQNSFTTEKTTDTVNTGTSLIVPIDYLPSNTSEAAFYGLTGKVKVVETATPSNTKQYTLELGYYNASTDSFTVIQSLGSFDSGISNAFIDVRQPTFPVNSLWSTTSPTTDRYLAVRATVTTPAGATDFTFEYDVSIYYNLKY